MSATELYRQALTRFAISLILGYGRIGLSTRSLQRVREQCHVRSDPLFDRSVGVDAHQHLAAHAKRSPTHPGRCCLHRVRARIG